MRKYILPLFFLLFAAQISMAGPPSMPGGGGVSSYGAITALFDGGTCSGYLKSDGTCDTPTGGTAGKVCKTITNPSTGDTHILFDVGAARTITKISGIAYPSSTSASVKLHNAGADGSGTTAINSTALTIDSDGANTETINSATVTDMDIIYAEITAVSGVCTQVMVCYE